MEEVLHVMDHDNILFFTQVRRFPLARLELPCRDHTQRKQALLFLKSRGEDARTACQNMKHWPPTARFGLASFHSPRYRLGCRTAWLAASRRTTSRRRPAPRRAAPLPRCHFARSNTTPAVCIMLPCTLSPADRTLRHISV